MTGQAAEWVVLQARAAEFLSLPDLPSDEELRYNHVHGKGGKFGSSGGAGTGAAGAGTGGSGGAAATGGSHGGGSAATGQAALDAVPLGMTSTGLSTGERAAMRAYTEPEHFLSMNGKLRGEYHPKAEPATPAQERHIKNLRSATDKSRLTQDAEVWRGIQGGADRIFGEGRMSGNMTGLEWQEKAFTSTSVRKSSAQEFTQSRNSVLLRIRVPKGTGAVKMADREWDGEGEAEVVLSPGLKFRVTADHGVDRDWGHRTLDVEVIPE